MQMEQFERLMWILAAGFFSLAILGAVGEFLGWWNDIGEILMSLGTGGGFLAGVGALYSSSSKHQVAAVAEAVQSNGTKLDTQTGKLDEQTGKLDEQTGKLDEQTGKLDEQTGKLDEQTGKLDEQTGKLDEQTGILAQIRDRL